MSIMTPPHSAQPGASWPLLFMLSFFVAMPAYADRCDDLIKMDGLLSTAKKECPFSYYAFRFQQDSLLCMEKKGPEASKKLVQLGQSAYHGKAKTIGKEALCQKLLVDFPMTVKR